MTNRRSTCWRFIEHALGLAICMAIPVVSASALLAAEVHVVDGDTIDIGQTRIRLFGIDAPEASQLCNRKGGGTWPCGKVAIRLMENLVAGNKVDCDDRGLDNYGRVLAICKSDGVEINGAMVENGLAWSFRRYSSSYNSLEVRVRELGIGVWQAPTEPPWIFRAHRWEVARQAAPLGCPIKGNISRTGEKIYHTPWSPWYTRTRIDVSKGERWFCDEAQAIEAGWRAPRWGR